MIDRKQVDTWNLIREATKHQPELAWWQPAEVGEELVGVVEEMRTATNRDGQRFPLVVVILDDGTRIAVSGTRTALARLIERHDPRPGDAIRVEYLGKRMSAKSGREFHSYEMDVAVGVGLPILEASRTRNDEPAF